MEISLATPKGTLRQRWEWPEAPPRPDAPTVRRVSDPAETATCSRVSDPAETARVRSHPAETVTEGLPRFRRPPVLPVARHDSQETGLTAAPGQRRGATRTGTKCRSLSIRFPSRPRSRRAWSACRPPNCPAARPAPWTTTRRAAGTASTSTASSPSCRPAVARSRTTPSNAFELVLANPTDREQIARLLFEKNGSGIPPAHRLGHHRHVRRAPRRGGPADRHSRAAQQELAQPARRRRLRRPVVPRLLAGAAAAAGDGRAGTDARLWPLGRRGRGLARAALPDRLGQQPALGPERPGLVGREHLLRTRPGAGPVQRSSTCGP